MMDWVYMAPDLPGDYFSQHQLGFGVGDDYNIDPKAITTLENIIEKLEDDEKTLHNFRRSVAFSRLAEKDLVPMLRTVLKNVEQPSSSTVSPAQPTGGSGSSHSVTFGAYDERLVCVLINLLSTLTTPLECLVSVDELIRTKEGGQTLSEIKQHHSDIKDLFVDPKLFKVVLRYVDFLLSRGKKDGSKLTSEDCNHVLTAITLIRNILHIPTPRPSDGSVNTKNRPGSNAQSSSGSSEDDNRQNCILWSLFCNDLDVSVINLILSAHVGHWCSILMQVIALVYKDQHVQTLERSLHQWLETSISESSEDNESNTSPAERCVEESAEELTSMEPTTDDSSDGNGAGNETKKSSEDSAEHSKTEDSSTSGIGHSPNSKESDLRSDNSSDSCGKEPPRKRASTSSFRDYATLPAERSERKNDKKPQSNNDSSPKKQPEEQLREASPSMEADEESSERMDDVQQQIESEVKSNSSSSNDDGNLVKRKITPHANLQKPRPKTKIISPTEKRELRRQKLIQRSKASRMKVKAMVHHIPNTEDIAEMLTEFTVDFLLKGFSNLVTVSREKILMTEASQTLHMEQSHYLWLVTYFLKFAAQLEVDLEQIGPVLSVETISYLTFEGVRFFEELELCTRDRNVELTSGLRSLHLLVTAISEFIDALETYSSFTHLSEKDKKELNTVKVASCGMSELRSLLLLLTRRFNPSNQTRQYLTDVIRCNHMLLVMTENTNFDTKVMTNHLSQFATVEVMRQYGYVLENFRSNPQLVNDAIFTMMHHISGDLLAPESLFVPQILATFSDMWEEQGTEICEVWTDLIEYVIQKFITTMGTRPHDCASNLLECIQDSKISEAVDENGFTKSQLESLNYYYSQCEDADDTVGAIIEKFKRSCNLTKTRLSVIQALLSQGIITFAQYMSLMYMKSVLSPCKNEHEGSVIAEVGSEHYDSDGHDAFYLETPERESRASQRRDQIEVLKELLKAQGKESLITWLQQILLEACYVKLNGGQMITPNGAVVEPTVYHYNLINKSIPMVAWNKQQESGLQTETFIMLLHKLGFHLAADVGKLFPRIPHFWSADHILQLIHKLGPVKRGLSLKMDLAPLSESEGFIPDDVWATAPSNSSTIIDDVERNNESTKPTGGSVKSPEPVMTEVSNSESTAATDGEVMDTDKEFAMPTPTTSWLKLVVLSKQGGQGGDQVKTAATAASLSSSKDETLSDRMLDDDPSQPLERMQLSEAEEIETVDEQLDYFEAS